MIIRNATALRFAAAISAVAFATSGLAAAGTSDARVTQIVRDVKLLEEEAAPRPAAMNDRVADGDAIRTGTDSRSELRFPDETIVRLGSNTICTFNRSGRDMRLTNGSILLQAPSASGGRNIRTAPVTVAITGTTLIFEHIRNGSTRLTVLEGGARLSLSAVPGQSRTLRGGQTLEVPRGARTLGTPVEVDLDGVMKTHPLVRNFRALPSRDRIARATREQANRAAAQAGAGSGRTAPGAPQAPGTPGAAVGGTTAPPPPAGGGPGRGP
jgi:hypothetical protein